MVDTYHKIKKQMSGIPLDMGYLDSTNKSLMTRDELNVLKSRISLFKSRTNWIYQTMTPLLIKLDKVVSEVKTLGSIDTLNAVDSRKYFTELGKSLNSLKKELDDIVSDVIWKGETYPDNTVEANIVLNSHFKPMVEKFTAAIDVSSEASTLILQLEARYNFLLRKEIAISDYGRLRTYLTSTDIKNREQSITNDNEIVQLEAENTIRKTKLAQYKQKMKNDGNDKTDSELDVELANSPPVPAAQTQSTLPINLSSTSNVFSQNIGPPKIHNVKLLSPFDQSKNLALFNLNQEISNTPDVAYQNEIDAANANTVDERIKALTDNSNVNDIRGNGEIFSIQVNAINDTEMKFGVSLQNNNGTIFLPNMVQIGPKPLKDAEFKNRWGVSGVFYVDLSDVNRTYNSLKDVYKYLQSNFNSIVPKIETLISDKMKVKDSSFEVTLDVISANGMEYLYAPSTEAGTNDYKFVDDLLNAYDNSENVSNILKAVGLPVFNFTTREELKNGLKKELEQHVGGIGIFKSIRREGNIDVFDFNVACKSKNEFVCYRITKTHADNISDLRKNGIAIFVNVTDLQSYNDAIEAASATSNTGVNTLEEQDTDDEDIKTFKFTPTL